MVGSTISHYKITEKLGEGGMGVVYKAEDTKLKRTVALKFLRSDVLEDDEHKERFLREAQAAASLNHPNICVIHEIDEAEGSPFIAMELVEGESVKEKIKARPLKLDEAIDVAVQTAEGLKAAHNKGVVHRDIKPANLMLTEEGQVKIMDFGLAQLAEQSRLTKTATILGTPAYMSPEQAKRQPTDRRTDVWSLGAVIYEMVTGRLPFGGERQEAVLYAIGNEEPEPITALRAGVPMELEWIVGKALAKDADERYQHVEETIVDLRGLGKKLESGKATVLRPQPAAGQARTPTTVPPSDLRAGARHSEPASPDHLLQEQAVRKAERPARRLQIGLVATLVAAVAVIVALWLHSPEPHQQRDVVRFTLTPGTSICTPVISPNGRHIAYIACEEQRKLWIWNLNRGEPREIDGTEGAKFPFWSPGGDFIGFAAGGELKKVSLTGGPAVTLCPLAREFWGGTWSPDGKTVVFVETGSLYEVPSTGGTPKRLIEPEDSLARLGLYHPHFLPLEDGRQVLLFSTSARQLVLQNLDTGKRRIVRNGNMPVYAPSGHILYWSRLYAPCNLWALPFSIEELKATGKPFLLAEDVWLGNVATNGTLVYLDPDVSLWQLVWRDRSGKRRGLVGRPQKEIYDPVLSPDGRTVLVAAVDKDDRDIWAHDVNRPVKNPLTSDVGHVTGPVWSPSGNRVAFVSQNKKRPGMLVKAADLGAEATVLLEGGHLPLSWSADEKYLLYSCAGPETGGDLCYLERKDDDGRYEPLPYVETPFEERAGAMSPDGRFVAYASNEAGRYEVYVQRFPTGGDKQQVSDNGGGQPVWSKDGKELFYVEGDTLVVVPVTTKPSFSADPPGRLFRSARFRGVFMGTDALRAQYDASADGQRIVLAEPVEEEASTPPPDHRAGELGRTIHVVQNWYEEFRAREQD